MILVCSYGRSGSSLTMQMLFEAGLKCGGNWPSFEDPRQTQALPHDTAWLSEYAEGALKILDPLKYLPPALRLDAQALWLHRDAKQQARSWAKIMRRKGRKVSRQEIGHQAKWRRKLEPASKALVRQVIGKDLLLVDWDRLLANPVVEAKRMCEWFGLDANPYAMAACVVNRPPVDLRHGYLLEETLASNGKLGGRKLM